MDLEFSAKLRRNIMLRIYGIWLLRRLGPVLFFEVLFLILATHLFAGSVFVARVFENAGGAASGGTISFVSFAISAIINARIEVKMEILVAFVFGALFLWSVKRAIVSYEMIRRGRQQ